MGAAKNIPINPDKLFLPFQAAWVRDASRLKLMEKSRQIGVSWATAYRAVETTAASDARYDQWVSSRDEIQARLFLEDCKAFADLLHIAAQDMGLQVVDADRKYSAFVLQFANGKRIHSMSSNPDAQAGKRGSRILDEFALHPDPRKLYTIAYPGITWGGNMEIISTHRGSGNYFNGLIEDIRHRGNPKNISLHRVTLQDALDQGFLYKLQAKLPQDDPRQDMDEAEYFDFIRSGCAGEEQFLQEYMCVPADDAAAFLTYDEISSCEYRATDLWEMDGTGLNPEGQRGELYIGMDVGRHHDLTCIWIIERQTGGLVTRKLDVLQGVGFSAQEAVLYGYLTLPHVRRCCIDNTGIGMQLAERAQEKFGTYKVEPVTFTGPVKEALAYPVRAAFEDKAIRIPADDQIRNDLRGIKKSVTAAGNIRFDADRGTNGHADRFWALALAVHAAKNPAGPMEYESIEKRRATGRGIL